MNISDANSIKMINELPLLSRARLSLDQLAFNIPIKENNEPMVGVINNDIVCKPFWLDERNIEGDAYLNYISNHPEFKILLRKSVYEKLIAAQQNLPKGWKIAIKAGYRPPSVQKELFNKFCQYLSSKYPDMTADLLLKEARQMVSDPEISTPPHTTGAAVDVELLSAKGNLIDMGCLANTDGEIAHIFSSQIDDEQKSNRLILLEAMLSAGFANLAHEWWHYSYGDQYWAVFYGKDKAHYNTVKQQ